MTENDKNKIKIIESSKNNFFTEEDTFLQKNDKKNKNDNFITKLIIFSVLLSFILVAVVIFVPFDKLNQMKNPKSLIENQKENDGFNLFKKRENILLLGVDSNGKNSDPFEYTRTDTIMLVSFDSQTKSANIISIPRDSKVYIEGHGTDKINAAHAVGGIDLTLKTIQEMFGVKIDHYVLVNYDGLKEIVKILGTIPVTVEKKLRYTDYSGGLYVRLEPGKQELNADQVEQFVRFRHDAIGDIGRVERQRMLIKGLVEKLKTPEGIAKLPEIISASSKYVKTDMTVFDMTRYAGIASSVNTEDIITATLPGHPSQNSHISYWILEPDRVQSIINRLVYRENIKVNDNKPLTVSILYDNKTSPDLDVIKEKLKESNIEVICTKNTKKMVSEIIAHTDKIDFDVYKGFKTLLPQLKPAHMTIAYDLYYCGESDATLVMVNEK